MSDIGEIVAANVVRIRQRIGAAARRGGRQETDLTLVAVTKYVDCDTARALLAAGCSQLGESRPQELWRKAEALADLAVAWHMIGHLQRNKIRRTLPHVSLLHSGDSLPLLVEVDRVAAELEVIVPVLMEVNISQDANKHGFAIADLEAALPHIAQLEHIRVRGLMAMASLEGDLHDARASFAGLRQLRDRLRLQVPSSWTLDELSMGMSEDFEVAIEEGATMVRVGSALLEGITR